MPWRAQWEYIGLHKLTDKDVITHVNTWTNTLLVASYSKEIKVCFLCIFISQNSLRCVYLISDSLGIQWFIIAH